MTTTDTPRAPSRRDRTFVGQPWPLASLFGVEMWERFSFYGMQGIAELLLSPVGLSAATKLAPDRFRTQMVALFFLSIALGTAASGTLANYYSEDTETAYFGILGAIAIMLGLVLAALTPLIRRLMNGVR
jgi:dipeptide/tripeptide permease